MGLARHLCTTGEYVGRYAARKVAAEYEHELLEIRAEGEMMGVTIELRITRAASLSMLAPALAPTVVLEKIATPAMPTPPRQVKGRKDGATRYTDPTDEGPQALQRRVKENLEVVTSVAKRSDNLKGGFVKALRDAAKSIETAVEVLAHRTPNEEAEQMERANEILKKNNEGLRKEVKDLRKMVEEMKGTLEKMALERGSQRHQDVPLTPQNMEVSDAEEPPPPKKKGQTKKTTPLPPSLVKRQPIRADSPQLSQEMETLTATILSKIGALMSARFDARFEALESRLPPEKRFLPPSLEGKLKQQQSGDQNTTKKLPQQQQQARSQQRPTTSYAAAAATPPAKLQTGQGKLSKGNNQGRPPPPKSVLPRPTEE